MQRRMQTIARQIYPERFRQVEAIVGAIRANDPALAKGLLSRHLDELTFITGNAERLQTELFLEALRTRLKEMESGPESSVNLYLTPDQGRQIRLFNLMAAKFPVVRQAQDIANTLLMDAVAQEDRFILLDIGMGTGQQAANLVTRMRERCLSVQEILLIGIDPSEESLFTARRRFQELAEESGLSIAFTDLRKTAEQMDEADWMSIQRQVDDFGGTLILNASFALHHMQPVAGRTDFFRRLKSLEPALFMLIEPYGDYTTDDVLERFHNAWHHYGLTFRAIDTIDASDEEKNELKRVFFGRELLDVLALSGRIEQYETGEMWLERLQDAGFKPFPFQWADSAESESGGPTRIARHGDYLSFDVHGYPIVAVIGVE